jgi:CRP-like cAMP-binding protein
MAAPLTNLLLDSLSPVNRDEILSRAKELKLPVRTSLQVQGETPRYAYFLTSGVASVVVTLQDGGSAEVALIGRDGIVGALPRLGPAIPPTDCFIQLAASGYRIAQADLKPLFLQSEEIRSRILESVQQQAMSMGQIAACNKLHEAEARLARWFLMVQDIIQEDAFNLTQEFIAEMLGTRRTTVALAAGSLQRAGFIEYKWGKVTILSRDELRTAACDCYSVVERLVKNLYH